MYDVDGVFGTQFRFSPLTSVTWLSDDALSPLPCRRRFLGGQMQIAPAPTVETIFTPPTVRLPRLHAAHAGRCETPHHCAVAVVVQQKEMAHGH